MNDVSNYSLLRHNTFGIDVRATRFVEYTSKEELLAFIPNLKDQKFLHIGGGSNLLFTKDYEGTILHSDIKGIYVESDSTMEVVIRVGSGEQWDDFVAYCVDNQFYGAENLSLIPGEVGAAAVQNIGAYGAEVQRIIERVEVVDLETGFVSEKSNKECEYSYRYSKFKDFWRGKYAIVSVTFKLSKIFSPDIEYGTIREEIEKRHIRTLSAAKLRSIIIDIRNEKLPDPSLIGNAGSFFMNPVVSKEIYLELAASYPAMPHYKVDKGYKIPAGWLIEQCGWKGKSLGKAGVHSKQALVLVNCGGASGSDIVELSNAICQDVAKKFKIEIKSEVNWI